MLKAKRMLTKKNPIPLVEFVLLTQEWEVQVALGQNDGRKFIFKTTRKTILACLQLVLCIVYYLCGNMIYCHVNFLLTSQESNLQYESGLSLICLFWVLHLHYTKGEAIFFAHLTCVSMRICVVHFWHIHQI